MHRWIRESPQIIFPVPAEKGCWWLFASQAFIGTCVPSYREVKSSACNEATFLHQRLKADGEGGPAPGLTQETTEGHLAGGVLFGSSVWLCWMAWPENQSEQTLIHFSQDKFQPRVFHPQILGSSKGNGFLSMTGRNRATHRTHIHLRPAHLMDSSWEISECS